MKITISFLALLLMSPFMKGQDAAKETEATIRQITEKAVPYIEKKGASWIEKRDCLSCHHTSFMVWSLNSAQRIGVNVSNDELKKWNLWATNWRNLIAPERRDEAERVKSIKSENDAVSQLLLGKIYSISNSEEPAEMAEYLAASQKGDGSWKAGGQLPQQKRSVREINESSTMWALLALLEEPDGAGKFKEQIDKGMKWLGSETNGESTEWWAVRMLIERNLGNDKKADERLAELKTRQKEDGGWGWISTEQSDALATGIVLFALAQEGFALNDPAVTKAITFLKDTQRDDGSWLVHGTKKKARDEEAWTAVFWGACWAVIGMAEFIEESAPAS